MIFATAGHVDHGKTTLIQAITGVDTTHLPEEKKRGMTIDLGYAYWPQPDGSSVGFVDVPGHEKFLPNMLAGMGGIDHILLVVACDDGVMAQTREHLAILRLIGRPDITVVLTKADSVEQARIEEVRQQVGQLLASQGWQSVPLFITAAAIKEGIIPLREHLQSIHQARFRQNPQHEKLQQRFRLAIDRVFTIKGAGLVVTGTALAGRVNVGDMLWLTGSEQSVRVRGLHAQNQLVQCATAGQRIALNIVGDISKEQISRGDWLLLQKPSFVAEKVLVEIEADLPLQNWQSFHIHHAASHITGRISILNSLTATPILAELTLDRPLWLVENDRLVLRDISARKTLAGARVVSLNSPRRGKRQPEFLHWLSQLARTSSHLENLTLYLTRGALLLSHFAWARQLTESQLSNLLVGMEVMVAGDWVLSLHHVVQAEQKLLQTVEEYHEKHPDQLGVGKARLKRMALPTLDDMLAYKLINRLLEQEVLKQTHGWLHLPEHGLMFTPEQACLWLKAEPYFKTEAWWVRDLATEMGEDEEVIRRLLRKAAQLGLVIAIVSDRYYHRQQIQQLADLIRNYSQTKGGMTAIDFRDELGIGRKLAIQILEYFDRTGFTRRKANLHVLRDEGIF
ncbi:selenocysteine-specific translation elongation factor [Xenorhabdus griffiniae]|uniref:Selenocysteine-specific elongation factor n=1 Tax=Xenorhabdus griffiniae TaxID=351672 RepID=A0ABY9XNQ7_9GAMM|nr:selenocysteine-specific translation elongation factor [Xenorhabdus griffiniae]MBD1228408.1 selenocysteine-specific translation elongation factor [Xenorhabdus griffiniae]MBE8587870.1 selenocysteine-specific translation elongation factor [Xenorhabdus griffiniae]WMV74571.1 selenocysteine-specific translation elongation factor [Xenorhabdus griffiniae]WNH04250.1 selenocysteine-specific translation elongation factor [Xenorhabdus griffiniae]